MKIKHSTTASDTPNNFVTQHARSVIGVLSGFDRVRLLASLRPLYAPKMMMRYLSRTNVLLKDFAGFVTEWTERVRASVEQQAKEANRPITYLNSSSVRKESLARELAKQDGINEGLIGIWSCVEPCLTYFVRGNRDKKQLELRLEPGKCLHYYFYQEHPVFGFMHLRLQTWFPFQVSVCVNGRHWLAGQMDKVGLSYQQRENCLPGLKMCPRRKFWQPNSCKRIGPACCSRFCRSIIHSALIFAVLWRSPITGVSVKVNTPQT